MERLDRFTDPFDGPNARENAPLSSFNAKLASDYGVRQQMGKITLKTIPTSRPPRPPPIQDVVKPEDIDWNSLVDVLDEAAYRPTASKAIATYPNTPRPTSNLSVTVVPTPSRLFPGSSIAHKRIRPIAHEDPYEKFLKGVFNESEPAMSEEESEDEDFTVAHSTGRNGDEDDEYRNDASVQISMKELLDLFEDEYFVRGRHISVDRLRKRLEHLDEVKSAKVGFSTDQIQRLDDQICRHIQLTVQSIALCGELVGADCVIAELIQSLVPNLNHSLTDL